MENRNYELVITQDISGHSAMLSSKGPGKGYGLTIIGSDASSFYVNTLYIKFSDYDELQKFREELHDFLGSEETVRIAPK
jgi:hypothetical protein